jgi:O-antigen/teichoic acid export membrane protein
MASPDLQPARGRSLLGRARPLLLARFLTAVVTIVLPMVLTRLLDPAAFGTYKQVWLVASTLHLIVPMGIVQSLYYFVPREPERRAAFIAQTVVVTTAAGAAAALLVLAARPLVAQIQNPALTAAVPWIAALTFFLLAGSALDAAYTSLGRITEGALVRAVSDIGRGLAGVVGGLATSSVTGVLAGLAAASAARAILTWILLLRGSAERRPSGALLRRQLAYALPFGAAALLFVPQQNFHQYAVAASVTAAAFAVYSVAIFHLAVIDILYTPISEVLQLGLAEADRRGDRGAGLALFHEAVSQLAVLLIPIGALLFAVAPALVQFLFTERYLGAVPLMRISLVALLVATLPLDGVLRAHAQRRFMLGSSAVKLSLTIPAVLAGLRLGGTAGALVGWLAVEAAVRLAQLARAGRLFGAGAAHILPWRKLAVMAVAAGLAAPLAAWTVGAVPGPVIARLVAAGLAFTAVYAALVVAGGAAPVKLAARAAMRFNAATWRRLLPRPASPPRSPPPAAS